MRTIEIRTTQNVVIEYELAPLRERIFAELATEDSANADVRRSVSVSHYFLGVLRKDMAADAEAAGDAPERRARLLAARNDFARAREIQEALLAEDLLPPGDAGVIDMLRGEETAVTAALEE